MKPTPRGTWVAQSVKHLCLAGVVILSPGMEPHIGLPAQWGSASPAPSVLSLSLNKILKQ